MYWPARTQQVEGTQEEQKSVEAPLFRTMNVSSLCVGQAHCNIHGDVCQQCEDVMLNSKQHRASFSLELPTSMLAKMFACSYSCTLLSLGTSSLKVADGSMRQQISCPAYHARKLLCQSISTRAHVCDRLDPFELLIPFPDPKGSMSVSRGL